MDKAKENIEILLQSLDNLDFRELSGSIRTAFKENPNDDRLATFALKIQQFSENKHSKKIEVLLKNSKVRDVVLFDRLLKYPERQLDMELIDDLAELHFLEAHENVILWGSPGTGKTWLAKALINNACKKHIRCRCISFPALYRDLESKNTAKNQSALDSRFRYYASFPLLFIDEFPNCKMKNAYLVQEFFDERCSTENSTIICSQASPEKWPELFEIRSFGESVRGRLEQRAKVIEMKGPDLRLFKPATD